VTVGQGCQAKRLRKLRGAAAVESNHVEAKIRTHGFQVCGIAGTTCHNAAPSGDGSVKLGSGQAAELVKSRSVRKPNPAEAY
jgi:hypothetical protein